MSISKSQAAALAEGFLDNLGSGREGLQPKGTLTELFSIAAEMVEDMQHNLIKSNSIGSGKLSGSISAEEPQQNGSIVSTNITMQYYGQFVNKGVKGLQSGSSTAGYSFRTPLPSPDMVKALQAGINNAKKSTANVTRTYGKLETKNKKLSDASKAFGAGVNIKKFGITPTGFLDKAANTAVSKVGDRLGAALAIDVFNSLDSDKK